jgi:hypothetical protein
MSLGPSYCSYAHQQCACGNNPFECAKRNPVECRNCRQHNEQKEQAAHAALMGITPEDDKALDELYSEMMEECSDESES